MKKKITGILLSIIVFLLYYYFPYITDFIIDILNIDLTKLNRGLILSILVFIELLPVLFLVIIYRKDLKKEFKIYTSTFKEKFDKYVTLWIIALVLMTVSNTIISIFTKSNISNNEEAIRDIASLLPLYSLFTSSICAPIGEELAYRKTIGNIFKNKKLAIIISGLIFGLAHVLGTYTGPIDLLYVIPYGLFGSVFMYMYLDSKTIYSTMGIHFLHNTILMINYFIRF